MNQLILVVEDDATMQKMALKILRSRGFSCELARSGREAVAMAAALKPALILMDLSLPEMNGWEATRALKADPALAPIPWSRSRRTPWSATGRPPLRPAAPSA